MAEKKHNNDNLNVEDALSKSETFIINNKKSIIASVVAIVVIIAGIIVYSTAYKGPRENKASEALFAAEELFMQNNFAQAVNGDSIGTIGFVQVAQDYKGTKAANLARGYAGICYARLGDYDKALNFLDGFKTSENMVSAALMGTAGNCYAQLGQLDKAASTLVKAADKSDSNTLSPIYLQQAGEIYVKLGKYDDALKAYNKIKNKYFQSYQAMNIDKYIEQASLLKK